MESFIVNFDNKPVTRDHRYDDVYVHLPKARKLPLDSFKKVSFFTTSGLEMPAGFRRQRRLLITETSHRPELKQMAEKFAGRI